MAITWSTLEAALDGADSAAAVLDALTSASMAELQETLDAIGAGEAGPLLAGGGPLLAAERTEDREQLATALEIIDRSLAADEGDSGDAVRIEILAALIAGVMGADAGQVRRRATMVLAAREAHLAAVRDRLDKKARKDEIQASGRVLANALQVLLQEIAPQKAKSRFGRRGRG
jgi:hypothetical protein